MTKKEEIIEKYKRLDKEARIQKVLNEEYYEALRSILGNSWAMFFFLLGGRMAGKSYAVMKFYVNQFKKRKRPFYWLRLTDASANKLLKNNAQDLVDPDLRRKYKLDLYTRGECVYDVKRDKDGKIISKTLMCRVLSLSTYYNNKGQGLFDNEFLNDPNMFYNICLDEMNREQTEKNTFSIPQAFANQLENIARTTKTRIRIICIGNTLDEASDILSTFNFIPHTFGRFYLKSKRAVIENIEPKEAYKKRRSGSAADILAGDESTFTNEIKLDSQLITKKPLIRPQYVIAFTKTDKYTVWNNNIIAPYNNEKCKVYPMRPYLDELYSIEIVKAIVEQFDARSFLFRNLITQVKFKNSLKLLRPKK